MLAFDDQENNFTRLGESVLYVYTSFGTSSCSGPLNFLKYCYGYHRGGTDSSMKKIVTILLLKNDDDSRVVQDAIPIVVNTTRCENEDHMIPGEPHYRLCCVYRPLNTSNPELNLRAVQEEELGFRLALQTHSGLRRILLLAWFREDRPTVYGYRPTLSEDIDFQVNSNIPPRPRPQNKPPKSLELGLLTFVTKGTWNL